MKLFLVFYFPFLRVQALNLLFWKNCVFHGAEMQGDQKLVPPPLPGQDEKFSGKTEYGIFKYNLFKYYLEISVKSVQN